LSTLNKNNECPKATITNKLTTLVPVQDQVHASINNPARNPSSKPPPRNGHKVFLVGDSHARLCATKIRSEIKDIFCVQGTVKPRAGTGVLVNTSNGYIANLTKKDVMIFIGGANDIAKNDSKLALRHISNFLNTNSNTNIVVVSVPHRYDLIQSSCVNREIKSFNRKLSKLAKAHQQVSFFKMSKHREFFTTTRVFVCVRS